MNPMNGSKFNADEVLWRESLSVHVKMLSIQSEFSQRNAEGNSFIDCLFLFRTQI